MTDDILSFLYTYPVEIVDHRYKPRFITHIPSFQTGDVMTQTVSVPYGGNYTDENGIIQTHYGRISLSLPQMIVTYTLKSDLSWSDGHALTANDIVFGYNLAKDPLAFGTWANRAEYTADLSVSKEENLVWKGLPGFLSLKYPNFLFPPQPKHKWEDSPHLTEIAKDHHPSVTGPYRISHWRDDDTLVLEPNPHYSGDPPTIQEVILRFPKVPTVFWPEMYNLGLCDILIPEKTENHNWETWLTLAKEDKATILSAPSETILRLDFNLSPDKFETLPLRSIRTRFGLANCISREHLARLPNGILAHPASTFIPEDHPAFDASAVWRVPYNREVGKGILSEIGWIDKNGDGVREAYDLEGIRDKRPLTLTLKTSNIDLFAAQSIAQDLQECGVGVDIDVIGPQQMFAESEVSPLISGDFQLVLYRWNTSIPEGCRTWKHNSRALNNIMMNGYNVGKFHNPDFNIACEQAMTSLSEADQLKALQTSQIILSEEIPTIFLIWHPTWYIIRPELQHFTIETSINDRISQPEYLSFDAGF
jgi:peptide/nickel transport system substrate-binding protein